MYPENIPGITPLPHQILSVLPGEVGASSNTIHSYRDTFSILIKYCFLEKNIPAEKLTLQQLDRKQFLHTYSSILNFGCRNYLKNEDYVEEINHKNLQYQQIHSFHND